MSIFSSKPLWGFVLTLTGVALYRAQRPGVMTPERDAIYRRCLNGQVKDTAKLREIANAFQAARLFPQAHLLRQRADLRDLPPEVKAQRREIFRKGMRSKNKSAVLRLADGFDSQGATTSAYRLRQYASGLPDIDSNSFAPLVTPEPASDESGGSDGGEDGGGSGNEGDGIEGERTPDTEPAPAAEKPIRTPAPPDAEPERGPERGQASSLNGMANGAAHA